MSFATESGILESHILLIKQFAGNKNCIILFRPVNPHATVLIGEGYGTKGLDIHGKSSDWGPMAGFIPRNQALSKSVGDQVKIDKGNAQNEKALKDSSNVKSFPLQLTQKLAKKTGEFSAARGKISRNFKIDKDYCVSYKDEGSYKPLEVMGYEKIGAVTADYDLFALLAKGGSSKRTNFDMQGVMTSAQSALITALNQILETAKTQKVINHGTECDNPFPEKDTRLALFLPNQTAEMLTTFGAKNDLKHLYAGAFALGYSVYCNDQWKGGTSGRPDQQALRQAYGRMVTDHFLTQDHTRRKTAADGALYRWFFSQKLPTDVKVRMSSTQRDELERVHGRGGTRWR